MAIARDDQRTVEAALARPLALIDGSPFGTAVSGDARERARDSARALFRECGGGDDAVGLVMLAFTAELLGAIAVDLAASSDEADRLIGRLQAELRIPRAALGREVLGTGRLLELPVAIAIEVALALLRAFAGAGTVSLWTGAAGEEPRLISRTGDSASAMGDAARAVLAGTWRPGSDTTIAAVAIDTPPPAGAALVAGALPAVAPGEPRPVAQRLLSAGAPLLAALLNRRSRLSPQDSPDWVLSAVERRLARLRFDLHDGPQQEIHLLAQDLRLFREQLRPMIEVDPDRDRALGRLDDLEAQLVALDGDLRRLATSVPSPFPPPASLPETLRQIVEAFAARTGVVPLTELRGSVTSLSDSQQIALLSLIREALTNIRQHSDAANVRIDIDAAADGTRIQIHDDGRGFDPEKTLVRAARSGHLGLVGMHERIRMLGGRTTIESRPGGPTLVSATLPRWPG